MSQLKTDVCVGHARPVLCIQNFYLFLKLFCSEFQISVWVEIIEVEFIRLPSVLYELEVEVDEIMADLVTHLFLQIFPVGINLDPDMGVQVASLCIDE